MIKVVVLGRGSGYGESQLILLPDHKIGIIDSTTGADKIPLALKYLDSNNLPYQNVDFIILTHFHKDHYLGISDLISHCTNARFFISKSLTTERFNFLFNSVSKINVTKNPFKEFEIICKTLKECGKKMLALTDQSKPILQNNNYSINVHSPSSDTIKFLDDYYYSIIEKLYEGMARIPPRKHFNLQSVVISIETNSNNILLGSDLENHGDLGWIPLFENIPNKSIDFGIFKVAHHGSKNGMCTTHWPLFINKKSVFLITPYSSMKLPREEQIQIMKAHCSTILSTAPATILNERPSTKIKNTIKEFELKMTKPNNKIMGTIEIETDNLNFELFESACEL